jgi:hypothetical protein
MSARRKAPEAAPPSTRGSALAAVLYFLVLAAFTSIAVVFGSRMAIRRTADTRGDAVLLAAADAVIYGALAQWDGAIRARQRIGTTTVYHLPTTNGIESTLWVTRLDFRIFSLVADARQTSSGAPRRTMLMIRVPLPEPSLTTALLSAVDISIGEGVSIAISDTSSCADSVAAGIVVSPAVVVTIDPTVPPNQRPTIRVDSSAADSTSYLRIGEWSWDDLVRRADVRLVPDADLEPEPLVAGTECGVQPTNWGEPTDTASPCASRAPVVYAPGDLTIRGGRGQGVLLVDGRLTITGPFTFSGQIVARRGLETHADAISISGAVRAWRAASESTHTRASRGDVVLTHGTSLRYSRCDAAHGIASWLQPRAVRAHAWTELF